MRRARKAGRDRNGRFKRGVSGNPKGRPPDMDRRKRFIEAYKANLGWPTRAARLAGFPEAGVRVAAVRTMRDPCVRSAVDAAWKAKRAEWAKEKEARALASELALQAVLRNLKRNVIC
jgi:hypothetical protein